MDDINFSWTGFRGFSAKTDLRLPRLTLLIGRNNVGKSSAYAPLLLLRQTLDARNPDTALLSRGPLIDVGPFRDFVSNHDVDREITFRVDLGAEGAVRIPRSPTRVRSMTVGFRSEDGYTAYLARQRVEGQDGSALVSRSRDNSRSAFKVASALLPSKLTAGRPIREITALRTELRQERPNGFLFSGIGALILPRSVREDEARWKQVQEWYNAAYKLYEVQTTANARVEAFLRGIAYLGPLRSLPQRTYRLGAESPSEVGGTGEFAPEMLFRLRESGEGDAVNKWLETLGYGRLHFEQLNDEYFQVHLERHAGAVVNLADTGVGLSQVVPLLVQASLARSGATVIAQQPEIHLNPAQQSIVTDFLIERANEGVRIVVESHSEHVLLRLRRRIAEGSLNADDVAVYFVDSGAAGTELHPVRIGAFGELSREEWPKGFFEDQLQDSFALAAAQTLRRNT